MTQRQIFLDTETTGLSPADGHKIIEIGCVEMFNRQLTGNNFHEYLQPDREIDAEAMAVHGIENEFLQNKPRFHEIAERFMAYISDAEVLIHNAPFDVGFLHHELNQLEKSWNPLEQYCRIRDTLAMARELHPGQKNNLDALCRRYGINNAHRTLHGALLDAEILADVYIAMTSGQVSLLLGGDKAQQKASTGIRRISSERAVLPLIQPLAAELSAHEEKLQSIDKASGGACLWLKTEATQEAI